MHTSPADNISREWSSDNIWTTNNHLAFLGRDGGTLGCLQILQSTKYVVLDLERHFNAVLGALLDTKRLFLESLERSRRCQVELDRITAWRVECEGDDEAITRIVGIAEIFVTRSEA